jgi:hypothetical protein
MSRATIILLALVMVATLAVGCGHSHRGFRAKVVGQVDEARYTSDGRAWQALNQGDTFNPINVTIQTHYNEGSALDLVMTRDGGDTACKVRLAANSLMKLNGMSLKETPSGQAIEMQLTWVAGPQVLVAIDGASDCSVECQAAPARLVARWTKGAKRGETVFAFKPSGDLIALSGDVVITNAVPSTTLRAGSMFSPVTGAISALPLGAPERKLWP